MPKTKDSLHIAVVELCSGNSKEKNFSAVKEVLKKIFSDNNKIDLVTFPENTFFMREKDSDKIDYLDLKSPIFKELQKIAFEKKVLIHVGGTPLVINKKQFNATVLIYPNGKILVPYKKIHLFDIQLENQKPVRESDLFSRGNRPFILNFFGWKIGLCICYDIRFSELFLYYQKKGIDLILIPSAFLVKTGEAHWHILNRARAIESQCYIASAAQGGLHGDQRESFGHSMVVSPWGDVLWENSSYQRPAYIICELKKELIQKVRTQIPMAHHRRIKTNFKF